MNWQDKRINELEKEIDKISTVNKQKGAKMKRGTREEIKDQDISGKII